ncbi:MAG: HNH endonuclease [Chlorobi bacterium]|nr:HNH endonuclease [Chlorobiota bacterium]MCI0716577.1 HNH endonuclease [Chlorobiota bacterium]
MASINGDWFHSRSSSNLEELLAVRELVIESQKPDYSGWRWSGSRYTDPMQYRFAEIVGVQPSTMQTKIRTMIRYGFIKEGNLCPLIWTRMGSIWNDLYTIGNYIAAQQIYELTLSISLAIFAFNDSHAQYSTNPAQGDIPLKFLLNNLDNDNSISLTEFSALVDGTKEGVARDASYWKRDLINSGLFNELNDRLIYTSKYPNFVREIKNFTPNTLLSDADWESIRDNPLIEISPFKVSIKEIFENITQQQSIEEQITDEIYTAPLVEAVSEEEESQIPELDILSTDLRFANSTRRMRNAAWAIRIKKKYNYICAVPNCDVNGQIFVEASHIKPDNVPDGAPPHRTHILNGICLCRHCHIAFDKGYFSLTDDHRIITSPKFSEIVDQNLKTVILSSNSIVIKSRIDSKMPLAEFIRYHRNFKFKN